MSLLCFTFPGFFSHLFFGLYAISYSSVMGGRSESTAELKDDCLVWEGEVKIVKFLKAPGFCILQNEPTKAMPKLSDTNGISFFVHPHTDFMSMSAVAQTDYKKYGFHVQYEAALEPVAGSDSGDDGLLELHANWANFKPTLMGRNVKAPKLEGDELDKVQVVVSTLHCSGML